MLARVSGGGSFVQPVQWASKTSSGMCANHVTDLLIALAPVWLASLYIFLKVGLMDMHKNEGIGPNPGIGGQRLPPPVNLIPTPCTSASA